MKIRLTHISTLLGTLMLFCCLFDPKDLLIGLKIPFFLLFAISVIIEKKLNKKTFKVPSELLLYLLIFSIFIPITSTIVFYFQNKCSFIGYQGFPYLKAYIFLFFTIFLLLSDNTLLSVFINLLFILSIVTIGLFFITLLFPNYNSIIYYFGDNYGIYAMPTRQYGTIRYLAIYFHTAPLLLISLGYYLNKFIHYRKISVFIYLIITILSLLLSGTRNTVFSAIIMPIVFYFNFSRNKNNRQLLFILVLSAIAFLLPDILGLMNSSSTSDNIKFQFAIEYFNLMKDPSNLIFGQGFGSTFETSQRGIVSLTELTYFEIFRRFGIFLGLLQIFLMVYPFFFWRTLPINKRWIILSYAFYLFIAFFNPFYFSSNGMIILSFVLISKYK